MTQVTKYEKVLPLHLVPYKKDLKAREALKYNRKISELQTEDLVALFERVIAMTSISEKNKPTQERFLSIAPYVVSKCANWFEGEFYRAFVVAFESDQDNLKHFHTFSLEYVVAVLRHYDKTRRQKLNKELALKTKQIEQVKEEDYSVEEMIERIKKGERTEDYFYKAELIYKHLEKKGIINITASEKEATFNHYLDRYKRSNGMKRIAGKTVKVFGDSRIMSKIDCYKHYLKIYFDGLRNNHSKETN